jgi:hypothetical protein
MTLTVWYFLFMPVKQKQFILFTKYLIAVSLSGLLVACGASDTSTGNQERSPKESASPEGTPKLTVGQMLASIDGVYGESAEYERRIAQAAERCGQEEIQTADQIVLAQRLLDDRGQKVTLIEIIEEAILGSIPPSEAGTFKCSEVISLYISLRLN